MRTSALSITTRGSVSHLISRSVSVNRSMARRIRSCDMLSACLMYARIASSVQSSISAHDPQSFAIKRQRIWAQRSRINTPKSRPAAASSCKRRSAREAFDSISASAMENISESSALPSTLYTMSLLTSFPQKDRHWSARLSASRMEPSEARAIARSPSSSIEAPASVSMPLMQATMSVTDMRLKSNR